VKVTKKKAMTTTVIATTILLLIYSAGAWRPRCRYAFEGVWLFANDQPESDEVVVFTLSPADITGKREGVGTGLLLNDDPILYGGAQWSSCHIEVVSTGKYTFEARGICYLQNDAEQVVLILPLGGTGTWIDENNIEFEFFSTIYMATQDADASGWPDEGQTPIMVNRWTYTVERMEWFPEPP
jgi:hypothetical protein